MPTPARLPFRRSLTAAAVLAAALGTTAAPAIVAAPVAAAAAAETVPGSTWTEDFLDTPDGERLHVDIIRREGLADDVRQPVFLIVSPYLGLSSPFETPGPVDRFFDVIVGADLLADYTVMMVSTRGTGSSSGCLDILGPGEQTDIASAVAYAVASPLSDGNVGMYGKSYDANTGAFALALQPEGLDAVVAQQIAPDRYRGSYADRVRLLQSLAYPSVTYGTGAEAGVSLSSSDEAILNSVSSSAECQALLAEHYLDDEAAEFWRVRDAVDRAQGSTVPALITTGYLDNATNIGAGAVDLFNALDGPKHLWIGWWDHVRGNDTVGDQLAMGREDWFGTVRRFLDLHVRGIEPAFADPIVAAQTSDGTWRSETAFPSVDTTVLTAPVNAGTYTDDGSNAGSADSSSGAGGLGFREFVDGGVGDGTWTFSAPLADAVHLAGILAAAIELGGVVVPRTNVVVNLYDVDESGNATMISRGAGTADAAGVETVAMFPTDWIVDAGHRVGLLVSGANDEAWIHTPTFTDVAVVGGSVDLPVLPADRGAPALPGAMAPRLASYRANAPFPVAADVIADGTNPDFVVTAPDGLVLMAAATGDADRGAAPLATTALGGLFAAAATVRRRRG